jgi:hypothetical protein
MASQRGSIQERNIFDIMLAFWEDLAVIFVDFEKV